LALLLSARLVALSLLLAVSSREALHVRAHSFDLVHRAIEFIASGALLISIAHGLLSRSQVVGDLIERLRNGSFARSNILTLPLPQVLGLGLHPQFGFVLLNLAQAFANPGGRVR